MRKPVEFVMIYRYKNLQSAMFVNQADSKLKHRVVVCVLP